MRNFHRTLTLLFVSLLSAFAGGQALADSSTTAPVQPAPPAVQQTAAPPSPAMVQAFQLGYDIYLPIAQMQYFDHEVKSLGVFLSEPLNDQNKSEEEAQLQSLNQLAGRTRQLELESMTSAVDDLKQVGVPAQIAAPYVQAQAEFAKPLPIAKDARKWDKTDPETAKLLTTILSTMEEADSVIPADTGVLPDWMHVARGADADWSFHAGTLEASLACASDNDSPAIALLSTIPPLVVRTPADAPAGAKDAMMDLAHEIEQKQDITQPMLAGAARALHKAFEGD